jgi:hypothetical protein
MKFVKKKYISIKLPASHESYPTDRIGHQQLPNYTTEYLKKHGRKLFEVLFTKVPASIYSELIKCIKEQENQLKNPRS